MNIESTRKKGIFTWYFFQLHGFFSAKWKKIKFKWILKNNVLCILYSARNVVLRYHESNFSNLEENNLPITAVFILSIGSKHKIQ